MLHPKQRPRPAVERIVQQQGHCVFRGDLVGDKSELAVMLGPRLDTLRRIDISGHINCQPARFQQPINDVGERRLRHEHTKRRHRIGTAIEPTGSVF